MAQVNFRAVAWHRMLSIGHGSNRSMVDGVRGVSATAFDGTWLSKAIALIENAGETTLGESLCNNLWNLSSLATVFGFLVSGVAGFG